MLTSLPTMLHMLHLPTMVSTIPLPTSCPRCGQLEYSEDLERPTRVTRGSCVSLGGFNREPEYTDGPAECNFECRVAGDEQRNCIAR